MVLRTIDEETAENFAAPRSKRRMEIIVNPAPSKEESVPAQKELVPTAKQPAAPSARRLEIIVNDSVLPTNAAVGSPAKAASSSWTQTAAEAAGRLLGTADFVDTLGAKAAAGRPLISSSSATSMSSRGA